MPPEIVDPKTKALIAHMIGSYGWLVAIAFFGILFKDAVHKAAEGILIFMGKDFCNDDILYINGRQARIVRVGILKTIFYMTDRKSKMVVPNDRLKMLVIEKSLPKNGGFPYLYKAGEAGYEQQSKVIRELDEIPMSMIKEDRAPKKNETKD